MNSLLRPFGDSALLHSAFHAAWLWEARMLNQPLEYEITVYCAGWEI